jgi:hypothetical protein
MSTERARPKAVIASPDGLTPNLKAKSRARRQRQRALAEIADHAPKRRNDLLPKLAVSYVPIDELRQAPRRVRRAHAEQIARIRASIESSVSANRSSSVRTGQSFTAMGSSRRRAPSG